jgi:hypothetical protein
MIKEPLICPFCEEGELKRKRCGKCGNYFLLCDECEAIYKDAALLKDDCEAEVCPHCGASI